MKKRILPFLTAVLVTLSGLTCQTDDICSDVQGSCLIIQVDAEIEAIPLTNATFETILTTATNTEFVGEPDQSHYLLRSLPALWRLTNLPDSVTPEQFTKLEVVARSASADGGKTPGEVIASGIVAPLSWTTGSKQRLEIKLAPVAKPSQLTPTRVPTSGGGIVTLTGSRICYPGHTRITIGGLEASLGRCDQNIAEIKTSPTTYQKLAYDIRVQTGSGRAVQVGSISNYPSTIDFSTMPSYPLADRAHLDPGNTSQPRFYYQGTNGNADMALGYRNGIAIGDFDGNGCPDIAVPNYMNGIVQVLWGTVNPVTDATSAQCSPSVQFESMYRPLEFLVQGFQFRPFAMTVQDLDDDGIDDLYVASFISQTETFQNGQGVFAFFGSKEYAQDRASFGKRWQRVATQAEVAPYLLVAGRVISNDGLPSHKQLIAVDGRQTVDGMGKINWLQRDQIQTCFGLDYRSKPQNGARVACTTSASVPIEAVREVLITPENGNGTISSVTPIFSRLPSDSKDYIDALIVTSYGNKQITIASNKRLPRKDVGYPSGSMFQGDFSKADDFNDTLGGNPVAAAFADVDGDGRRDLIVLEEAADKVILYKNTTTDGSYKLDASQKIALQILEPDTDPTDDISRPLTDIKTADLNNDGEPDVVISSFSSLQFFLSDKISKNFAFHSASSSTIQPDFQITNGKSASTDLSSVIQIADVNKDGINDIITINRSSSALSIAYGFFDDSSHQYRAKFPSSLYGDKRGQSQIARRITHAVVPNQLDATKADRTLIAVPNYGGQQLEIYDSVDNKPCCGVKPRTTIDLSDSSILSALKIESGSIVQPYSVILSDLNRDGKLDCAGTGYHYKQRMPPAVNLTGANGFVIWNCTEPGRSVTLINSDTAPNDQYVSVADIDGDQYQDLLFLQSGDAIKLAQNDFANSGTFLPSKAITLATKNIKPIHFATAKKSSTGAVSELIVASDSSVFSYRNTGRDPFFDAGNAAEIMDGGSASTSIQDIMAVATGPLRQAGKDDLVIVYSPSSSDATCKRNFGCILILDPAQPNSTVSQRIAMPYYPGQKVRVAISDIDNNGINDILVLSESRSLISIYLGKSVSIDPKNITTKWEFYQHISAGQDAFDISVFDYDHDGLMDIVTSIFQVSSVALIKNLSH